MFLNLGSTFKRTTLSSSLIIIGPTAKADQPNIQKALNTHIVPAHISQLGSSAINQLRRNTLRAIKAGARAAGGLAPEKR